MLALWVNDLSWYLAGTVKKIAFNFWPYFNNTGTWVLFATIFLL
jgi:hypothetical protein